MINPHGGILVNRIPDQNEIVQWHEYALFQHKIVIDQFIAMELELLASGGYSPLTGFMGSKDYLHVLTEQRLASGTNWALPVTLPVSREVAQDLYEGQDITIQTDQGTALAVMRIEEIHAAEKKLEVDTLYRGADLSHPGVLRIHQQGEMLLAGPIIYLAPRNSNEPFADYYLTPLETRAQFEELGWNTILAFEPRNPSLPGNHVLSKASDYDGIFLHPFTGDLSGEDLPAVVKIRCSEILLQEYYPPDRTLLAVSPLTVRGTGARDILHQAIVRKNYGATHMISGDQHLNLEEFF